MTTEIIQPPVADEATIRARLDALAAEYPLPPILATRWIKGGGLAFDVADVAGVLAWANQLGLAARTDVEVFVDDHPHGLRATIAQGRLLGEYVCAYAPLEFVKVPSAPAIVRRHVAALA